MSAPLIAALLGRDWLPLRIQSVIKTRGGGGGIVMEAEVNASV